MKALFYVAMLATNGWSATRYEVINHGENEAEIRQLPDMPEPSQEEAKQEQFFDPAPAVTIDPRWGTYQLADAYISAVRPEDRVKLLERIGRVKPKDGRDLRALLNLFQREDQAVRARVEAALNLLGPGDAGMAPFFMALLQDEDALMQVFAVIGVRRLRAPAAAEPLRALAEKPFPVRENSFGISPGDSLTWIVRYQALRALAELEGEKTLPLLMRKSKEAPAAAEIAAQLFWEKALPDFTDWSQSPRLEDQERAAKAWAAAVDKAKVAATKPALWKLLTDGSKSVDTRHRAALKLAACLDDADADRLVAARGKASGKERALYDAPLFAARHPKAVPLLVEYAKGAADPLGRAGAMIQLREMMPPADYRALLEWAAKNDADKENRDSFAAELAGR